MNITALGYLGFESPDPKTWEKFGPEIFGLGLADSGADGTVYLRMDDRHHRIALHPGEENRLAYIGWELRDKKSYTEARAELDAREFPYELGTPEECRERAVQKIIRLRDPHGFVHELFYAATFTAGSFLPGKPHHGFVAGGEGVGHVVMVVPDWNDDMETFVNDILGLGLFAGYLAPAPDGGQFGPQFFRCNGRSHCLGYVTIPGMKGVQHIAIEGTSLDDVGKAYDLVQERELQITMTLGRHMMDTLVSFYMRSPTGFDIEFGAGGVVLDGSYVQENPSTPEAWGHKFVADGWAPTVKPVG
jgi:2,3-dihydroxybiphenyl 1,2-dioxygenase